MQKSWLTFENRPNSDSKIALNFKIGSYLSAVSPFKSDSFNVTKFIAIA